jgi:hypothetical protein
MNTSELLSAIDSEIATLQQVRDILSGQDGHRIKPGPKPGKKAAKRTMSAEGRARIAAAQKARWTKQKLAAKRTAQP